MDQPAGVSFPLLAPKSPGQRQVTVSLLLMEMVISDGQSSRKPGASEHISALKDISFKSSRGFMRFGKRYSIKPFVNQMSCARILRGE